MIIFVLIFYDMINYFHRNIKAGYSINKVTQTIIRKIRDKNEYYVPCNGASLISILRNIAFVFKHREKKGVNHITGDIYYCALALIGCKSVITYHDTVALQFNTYSPIKKKIIEFLWYRIPLKIATKVVCISEETKRELQKYTKRKDLLVIHNAIDDIFEKTIPQWNDNSHIQNRVLLIGTKKNKNLIRTFEALDGLKCKVVIIGKLDEDQLNSLKQHHIDYENKIGLTDSELFDEYKNCDIVSFISLFEGFGMIVVEANKVGRPVICSNIPVLQEVANDAALLVDPCDVKQIRSGFLQLINDDGLKKSLVIKGFENAKRFDSSEIYEKWMELYKGF